MELRLLDEVMDLKERGVMLLSMDENAALLSVGAQLTDARGKHHTLNAVTEQDGVYMLLVSDGDIEYFERLFRDVRIDAALFRIEA